MATPLANLAMAVSLGWPSNPPSPVPRPTTWLRGLAEYWRHGYDWWAAERELNAVSEFTAEIDGRRRRYRS